MNNRWLTVTAFVTVKGGDECVFVLVTSFSKLEDIEQEDVQMINDTIIQMARAETGKDVTEMVMCFNK